MRSAKILTLFHTKSKFQAKRETLHFLHCNVITESIFLREISGMPSETFYQNYDIFQQRGTLKKKKEAAVLSKLQVMRSED